MTQAVVQILSEVERLSRAEQADFGVTQKVPPKYFLRRLGKLAPEEMRLVEPALLRWEGITVS
jgi:hypothetical protein